MKYIVIGAGISGLSVAQLLSRNNEVVVMEADARPGGMIKCDTIDGSLFHRTGGHVFNSKRQDVMSWFWSFFSQDRDFTKSVRNSVVVMENGMNIPYPIENHFYMFEEGVGKRIINELLAIHGSSNQSVDNFEDFLKCRFGDTLYEMYFQPYNEKIWRRNLQDVPLAWLEGKLPMPKAEEIIYNNIYHVKEQSFVHSSFFYPQRGGSQFLADRLAKDLTIEYNTKVERVFGDKDGKWNVNGHQADRVVFCGNLKNLPNILGGVISSVTSDMIDQLQYHGTTSVFCEINANPYSWVYLPSKQYDAHRIICTGNFSPNNNAKGKQTATVEFTDFVSEEEILFQLKKIPLTPKYITHHYEQFTYPLQDSKTRDFVSELKRILEARGLYLCGRFAEWEYSNMDVCMGSAIDLVRRIERE